MKYKLLFVALLLSVNLLGQTYHRNYEVKSSNKVVGDIQATLVKDGDLEQYEVVSEVSMTVIFKMTFSYRVQANYKAGVLVSSSATIFLNGNTQSEVDIERTGNHYTLTVNGHTKRVYEDINWTSAKMYFNKPEGVTKVFSETEGAFKNLSETADGKFRLKDPEKESNVNTYSYSSEQGLHGIEIERNLLPTVNITHVREAREPDTE